MSNKGRTEGYAGRPEGGIIWLKQGERNLWCQGQERAKKGACIFEWDVRKIGGSGLKIHSKRVELFDTSVGFGVTYQEWRWKSRTNFI